MKFSLKNDSIRVFFLSLIGLSGGLWRIFFFYGAYGEIFFEYILTIAFISFAVFCSYFLIPKASRPFGYFGALLFLFPLLWFASASAGVEGSSNIFDTVTLIIEFLILLVSLPYIFFFFVSVTEEQAIQLRPRRLFYILIIMAITISGFAYMMGKYNFFFLSCRDFKIAGMEVPNTCFSLKQEKFIHGEYD